MKLKSAWEINSNSNGQISELDVQTEVVSSTMTSATGSLMPESEVRHSQVHACSDVCLRCVEERWLAVLTVSVRIACRLTHLFGKPLKSKPSTCQNCEYVQLAQLSALKSETDDIQESARARLPGLPSKLARHLAQRECGC